jgi:hypothetical protein
MDLNRMSKNTVAILIICLLLPSGALPAEDGWTRYTNARYGASVEYPQFLTADGVIDLTDGMPGADKRQPTGIRTIPLENGTEFAIYGLPRPPVGRSIYDATCPAGACIGETYSVKRSRIAISSGVNGQIVFYRKCAARDSSQSVSCFEVFYPVSLKARFDPIVSRMSQSLR